MCPYVGLQNIKEMETLSYMARGKNDLKTKDSLLVERKTYSTIVRTVVTYLNKMLMQARAGKEGRKGGGWCRSADSMSTHV